VQVVKKIGSAVIKTQTRNVMTGTVTRFFPLKIWRINCVVIKSPIVDRARKAGHAIVTNVQLKCRVHNNHCPSEDANNCRNEWSLNLQELKNGF
jgi:hypothetical protein